MRWSASSALPGGCCRAVLVKLMPQARALLEPRERLLKVCLCVVDASEYLGRLGDAGSILIVT